MNHNVSNNSLFIDRPLTTTAVPAYRASTLRLLSADTSDLAEAILRGFLMLCLLISLAVCGVRINSGGSQTREESNVRLSGWSQAVPHVSALPSVQCAVSLR